MAILSLVVLFVLASLLAFTERNETLRAKIFYLALGVALVALASLRGGIDRDSFAYVGMYNLIGTASVEPMFKAISLFVRSVFDNVSFLFVIYALLGVTFKLIAIRRLTSLWFLSLAFYISEFFILHDMTQIRIGVASGLLLLNVRYIYDRKLLHFLSVTLVAMMFHYSAVVILPLWFITYRKDAKTLIYWLLPVGYLICMLNVGELIRNTEITIPYVSEKLKLYLNSVEYSSINVFGRLFLLKAAVYYFMLWRSESIAAYNRYAPLLLRIYGVSLFMFPALSAIPVFAFRFFEFFGVVEIVLFPMLYYALVSLPLWQRLTGRYCNLSAQLCIVMLVGLKLYISLFYVNLLG